jgi:hypothetical protein
MRPAPTREGSRRGDGRAAEGVFKVDMALWTAKGMPKFPRSRTLRGLFPEEEWRWAW